MKLSELAVGLALGVGAVAAVIVLVEAVYEYRHRGRDPRGRQVRQIIREAERLLSLGRRGASGARRARLEPQN